MPWRKGTNHGQMSTGYHDHCSFNGYVKFAEDLQGNKLRSNHILDLHLSVFLQLTILQLA